MESESESKPESEVERVHLHVGIMDEVFFLSKGFQFTSVEATFALNEPFYQKPLCLSHGSKYW